MKYPEMYYVYWWSGEVRGIIRFTPEKDLGRSYIVDKSKRYEVLWAKDENIKKLLERSFPSTTFQRNRLTEDKYKLINLIFGSEPRR